MQQEWGRLQSKQRGRGVAAGSFLPPLPPPPQASPPLTLPNHRVSHSCFRVMWSGSTSLSKSSCTWRGRRGCHPRKPLPPSLLHGPPSLPTFTHMGQGQLQAAAQHPAEVADLGPDGAANVLVLGKEGSEWSLVAQLQPPHPSALPWGC